MKDENVVEMEVFRAGDYGPKGAYSEGDLDRIAADYRPELLEAPLTFDHAQTGPAYGWVSRLRREGDRLVAVLKGVPAAVTDLVRKGAYKRRSVELFQKLPHTGRPYLRAVSLLGAATPEVKGLRDVCFAARQNSCSVEFADDAGADGGSNEASVSEQKDNPGSDPQDDGVDRAAQFSVDVQSRFAARADQLFAELRRDGFCLAQSDADALARLGDLGAIYRNSLNGVKQEAAEEAMAFAEEIIENGFAALSGILRRTLLRAPMGEAARESVMRKRQSSPRSATLAFSDGVTADDRVDPRSLSLHGAALQMMDSQPNLAYRDALLHAAQGGSGV